MSSSRRASLIGGHGFIGRHLDIHLRKIGWVSDLIPRNAGVPTRHLGHVFYCAGLTADFRERPFDTVEAHVTHLAELLKYAEFDSLTYLSSTRVYADAECTAENATLLVRPDNSGDLYNLSKLMGESLCLQSGREVRVARLSNVYGIEMPEKNFLAEVLAEAARFHSVQFRTARDSEKDYISVGDVVSVLPRLAVEASQGIYNLASGQNISNQAIAVFLESAGVRCEFQLNAPLVKFPRIHVDKLEAKFGSRTSGLVQDLPNLLKHYGETI